MKRRPNLLPLAGFAALLLLTGCGTVGEFLLGSLRKVVIETARTATSQAVEQSSLLIEAAVEQAADQVIQRATSQAADVLESGVQQLLDAGSDGATSP